MKFSNGMKYSSNISFLYLLRLTDDQQLWDLPVFIIINSKEIHRQRKVRDLKNLLFNKFEICPALANIESYGNIVFYYNANDEMHTLCNT